MVFASYLWVDVWGLGKDVKISTPPQESNPCRRNHKTRDVASETKDSIGFNVQRHIRATEENFPDHRGGLDGFCIITIKPLETMSQWRASGTNIA